MIMMDTEIPTLQMPIPLAAILVNGTNKNTT